MELLFLAFFHPLIMSLIPFVDFLGIEIFKISQKN